MEKKEGPGGGLGTGRNNSEGDPDSYDRVQGESIYKQNPKKEEGGEGG